MDSNAIELTIVAQRVAESLGIGRSTLNKYSRSLEEAGYKFVKDERGNRAYMERDIIALRHTISLLSKGVTYDKAMADTALKYTRIPSPESIAVGDTDSDDNRITTGFMSDSSRFVASLKQELASEVINAVNLAMSPLQEENQKLRSMLSEMLQRIDQSAATQALPSPQEQRSAQLNDRLTERRVERQLEREALDEWLNRPESERIRKTGLFRKEEDTAARDRFVRDYVDAHFEERIRKEFGE